MKLSKEWFYYTMGFNSAIVLGGKFTPMQAEIAWNEYDKLAENASAAEIDTALQKAAADIIAVDGSVKE